MNKHIAHLVGGVLAARKEHINGEYDKIEQQKSEQYIVYKVRERKDAKIG